MNTLLSEFIVRTPQPSVNNSNLAVCQILFCHGKVSNCLYSSKWKVHLPCVLGNYQLVAFTENYAWGVILEDSSLKLCLHSWTASVNNYGFASQGIIQDQTDFKYYFPASTASILTRSRSSKLVLTHKETASMNPKLSAIAFLYWHWAFPPERKLIIPNEHTPCVDRIENRPKGVLVTWKRIRLHACKSRALKLYTIFTIVSCKHTGHLWIQTTQVHGHPLHKSELSTPLAFCRKIHASFTKERYQYIGQWLRKQT